MKIIDTSVVAAGKQYPGLANVGNQSIGNGGNPAKFQGLDFLQQSVMDMADAMAKAFVVDDSVATWLSIKLTGVFPSRYISGYVYYGGEVFYVPPQPTYPIPMGMHQIANINPNPTDASPNPLTTMSDGSNVSIHNQRTISFTWVSSGTGDLPNVSDWKTFQSNFQWAFPTLHIVGSSGEPVWQTGWTTTTRLAFYMLGNQVYLQGEGHFVNVFGATGFIFILPNEYRPAYDMYFPIMDSIDSTSTYESNFLKVEALTGKVTWLGTVLPVTGDMLVSATWTIL